MPNDAFTTSDGLALRTRTNEPAGTCRARAVMVHGIGDQVDGIPYAIAARELAARGLRVHRLELRGHGQSGGARMYINSWNDFRNDLHQFVQMLQCTPETEPLFVIGMSMGGLVVVDYALHYPAHLAGVVAVAPALGGTGGSKFLQALLPVLSKLVPKLRINPKLDVNHLTRDALLQEQYVNDPLFQQRITPRLAAELFDAIRSARANAPKWRLPLLMLHGTADTVTSPRGSQSFVQKAGGSDKTYKTYEGAYHNLFVETNRNEVFDDIAAWVGERLMASR